LAEEKLGAGVVSEPVDAASAVLHELRVHQTELELQNQELRRTQSELEASRNRYFSLFDLAPLPYFLFDSHHHLSDLNLAAAELVGAERARIKGQSFHAWLSPQHRDQFHQHLNQVFLEPAAQTMECCLPSHNRGLRWVRFHSQQIPTEAGTQPLCLSAGVDFTERRKVEEALRRSEAELEAIYENAPLMMCLVNANQEVELMNQAMAEFVGTPNDSSESPPRANQLSDFCRPPDYRSGRPGDIIGCFNALDRLQGCGAGQECQQCPLRLAMAETFKTGRSWRQVESQLRVAYNGAWRRVLISASTTLLKMDGKSRVLVCLEDISGRKQLEAQLLQAQKMEAIGQLAGGVAHDFNNILAATMMNLALLKVTPDLPPAAHSFIRDLERGSERAANLTRQLLLFGRRQMMEKTRLNLNEVVAGMLNMLRRLLGEQIDIVWKGGMDPMWVEGDSGMIEQVIMNLCVNARDAMPKGGQLTLQSYVTCLNATDSQRHQEARAGAFVCLTVTDTGMGIDEATLKRIFEPFFTTKELGKGTGLGLATVYGIVKQHQGWVETESCLGSGTTFRVFLPEETRPLANKIHEQSPNAAPGGGETILLVEDDETLRGLIAFSLESNGYRIIEAGNGLEAIRQWERLGGAVDLIFADMVMPGGMTGLEVVERLRPLKPKLKAIISSGYSLDLARPDGKADPTIRFLPKPYQPSALARLLRESLDEEPKP
jgi:PAS domain S-box-containing protein